MKKILHLGAVTLPVAVLCLLLFCTDFKNNNPATTSYQGNYSLELSWVSPSDSVKEVFKEYKIACVHGRDTFSSYTVDSSSFLDGNRKYQTGRGRHPGNPFYPACQRHHFV